MELALFFLYKVFVLWLAADAIIIATIWFATSTIQPLFPGWWKAVVCDTVPTSS
ncbi:MAG: hypothetical protein GWN00_07425 [Aliifodinibius sp.]|nr:hypothetical protein [Fodinibius sp.]NIV11067.1 hypothetical protein [Fodinibius sp.]NIY24646.1 hypothetical protein [Fodinibius sp.]